MTDRFSLAFIRTVLFANGVVDFLTGIVLIAFPAFGWSLPGNAELSYQAAYAVGGWGTAAVCFGLGRIWAAYQPKYAWFMAALGLLEGVILTLYSLGRIRWSPTTFQEGAVALIVAGVFGAAYGLGWVFRLLPKK